MADAGPRVALGAPLFNHADRLGAALDSLLAQTHRDFALVLVDDGSTDATPEIAAGYARRDPRVTYVRNPERLGMIGNWRRSFALAREAAPQAVYFAWVSDHDHWEPTWLARMVEVLDAHPEVVLAYPWSRRILDDGTLGSGPRELDTRGVGSPVRRAGLVGRSAAAGWMVYGLMRVPALERAGVFRKVLQPDRLLMIELALQGELRQVPESLWHRRYRGLASPRRQRQTLFGGRAPWHARLPTMLTQPSLVLWRYGVRGAGRPAFGRGAGTAAVAAYLRARFARTGEKSLNRVRHRGDVTRRWLRHNRHVIGRRGRRAWRSLRIWAGRMAGRGEDY